MKDIYSAISKASNKILKEDGAIGIGKDNEIFVYCWGELSEDKKNKISNILEGYKIKFKTNIGRPKPLDNSSEHY